MFNFPFGRVDPKPPIISHENACIGDETLVVAKRTNLSLQINLQQGRRYVLEAAEALEVDEGPRWANRPGHSGEPSEGVEVVALDRHSGHREEHLLVELEAAELDWPVVDCCRLLFDCHVTSPFLQELERTVGALNTRDGA